MSCLSAIESSAVDARSRRRLPCALIRGGTSRATFFRADHLPQDREARDRLLLQVLGSAQLRRLDPDAGKLVILSRSVRADCDVDFLFGKADPWFARIDYSIDCGNLLAAAAAQAIEEGLVSAQPPTTCVRLFNRNARLMVEATVPTPQGFVVYDGDLAIDGVAGTGAPIQIRYLDATGNYTGRLFPTGQLTDNVDGIPVTCVDAGTPLILVDAVSLGKAGNESPAALEADLVFRTRLENLRLLAALRMGLGDCRGRSFPKICLVSTSRSGELRLRYFTADRCHTTVSLCGALAAAVGAAIPGTVAHRVSRLPDGFWEGKVALEHPGGRLELDLRLEGRGEQTRVASAAFWRTANPLFAGYALVPCENS